MARIFVTGSADGLGRMDAVIHNAGVYTGARVMAVNIVAPYLLTALIDRPQRLVYVSSGMHRSGHADLARVEWTSGSYSHSKLFVTTLAFALARLWPDVGDERNRTQWSAMPASRTSSSKSSHESPASSSRDP